MIERKLAHWIIHLIAIVMIFASATLSYAVQPETSSKAVHGAIYVSYGAYNAPQMWKNFRPDETRRDFGYARELHLNALRIWASYEYWQMDPNRFETSLNQMLTAAHDSGIRVLISLFENDGVAPTPENMWTTDPLKAFCIQSPGLEIASVDHKERWERPRAFLQWFMKKYGNDNRLIAIEVMNEPGPRTIDFAKSMFVTAKSMHGTVPLTVGAAKLSTAEEFLPLGEDIIEIHDNFPVSLDDFDEKITTAVAAGQRARVPVWLTEWQRLRPGGSGWGDKKVDPAEAQIDYASLAAEVRKYPVGNFFWSLMVKRAYLKGQRMKGTVNGLFWPDDSVLSLKDARAIANDNQLELKEKSLPADFLGYLKNPQGVSRK